MGSFNNILTEVEARLGNRTNLAGRTSVWVNDAYFELLMSPRFTFHEIERIATINTVVGQYTYPLPTGIWFILNIKDETSGREVRKGNYRSFDRRRRTTGIPNRYDRFGETIEIDPTPDTVVELHMRYRFRPAELSTGSVTIIGREWDEVITAIAVSKGFDALEQVEQATLQRSLIEALLAARQDVRQLEDTEQEFGIQVRV